MDGFWRVGELKWFGGLRRRGGIDWMVADSSLSTIMQRLTTCSRFLLFASSTHSPWHPQTMSTPRAKIIKPVGVEPDELENEVAKNLFDLEQNVTDLKQDLRI